MKESAVEGRHLHVIRVRKKCDGCSSDKSEKIKTVIASSEEVQGTTAFGRGLLYETQGLPHSPCVHGSCWRVGVVLEYAAIGCEGTARDPEKWSVPVEAMRAANVISWKVAACETLR